MKSWRQVVRCLKKIVDVLNTYRWEPMVSRIKAGEVIEPIKESYAMIDESSPEKPWTRNLPAWLEERAESLIMLRQGSLLCRFLLRVCLLSIFALWIRVTNAEGITWIGCPKEMEVGKWYQIKAVYTDQYGNKADVSIVLGANYETLAEWDTKLKRCRITKILKNCGYTTLFWTAATYYSGVAKSGQFRIPVKAGPVSPEIWDADIRGPDEIHPHTTNAYTVIAFNKEGKSLSGLEITYSLSSNDVCWLQNDRYIVVGDVEKKVYLDLHVDIFLNGQLFPGNKRIVVRAEDYCLNPVITSKAVASERIEEEVTIKCQTEGARIYYTLDGSDPSSTNGFLYDAPFRMEEAAMVKAVAYADNKDSSDIVVASVIPDKYNMVITDYPWGATFAWKSSYEVNKLYREYPYVEGGLVFIGQSINDGEVSFNPPIGDVTYRLYGLRFNKIQDIQYFRHRWEYDWVYSDLLNGPLSFWAMENSNCFEFSTWNRAVTIEPQSATNWLALIKTEDRPSADRVRVAISENKDASSRTATIHIGDYVVRHDTWVERKAPMDITIVQEGFKTPAAPVVSSEGLSADCVKISWESISDDEFIYETNAVPTTYEVYRSQTYDGNRILIGSTNGNQLIDYNCVPGTLYYYWVRGSKGRFVSHDGFVIGFRRQLSPFENNCLSFNKTGECKSLHYDLTNSWRISSYPSWISISKESGIGESDIMITAGSYTGELLREGKILFVIEDEGQNVECEVNVNQGPETRVKSVEIVGEDEIFIGHPQRYVTKVTFFDNHVWTDESVKSDRVTYQVYDEESLATHGSSGSGGYIVSVGGNNDSRGQIVLESLYINAYSSHIARKVVTVNPLGLKNSIRSNVDLSSDSDYGWRVTRDASATSGYSLKSSCDDTYRKDLTAVVNSGEITFRCKVPSQFNGDNYGQYLSFRIGNEVHRITYANAQEWVQFRFWVPNDETTVTWSVYKSVIDSNPIGVAYIDQIEWHSADVELSICGADSIGSQLTESYTCTASYRTADGENHAIENVEYAWNITNGMRYVALNRTSTACSIQNKSHGEETNVWLNVSCMIGGKEYRTAKQVGLECVKTIPCQEALSINNVRFSSGGENLWFCEIAQDGGIAKVCQAGLLEKGESNWLQMDVSTGGQIDFSWKLIAYGSDKIELYIDDVRQAVSDGTDWRRYSYVLGSGPHRIVWKYTRNSSGCSDVCAWVDAISWTPTATEIVLLNIIGPDVVARGTSALYKCRKTQVDGETGFVVAKWSVANGSKGEVGFSTGELVAHETGALTIEATFVENGVEHYARKEVDIVKGVKDLSVVGRDLLYVGDECQYRILVKYDDESLANIGGALSIVEGGELAEIIGGDVVRAGAKSGDFRIRALYEYANQSYKIEKTIAITNSIVVSTEVLEETKDLSIPVSWVRGLGRFEAEYGSDLAVALTRLTGKHDGSGKALSVWHDYVMGTDPTDVEDTFRANIEMIDDKPVVTWCPNLNKSLDIRTYKVLGRKSLSSADAWEYPANSAVHRFFKVDVSMPGENDGGSDIPGVIEAWQPVAIPTAVNGLVYDGTLKQGVLPRTGYTLSGASATGAGNYIASAVLEGGYRWVDGSQMNLQVPWSIAKANNAWVSEPAMTATTFLSGSAVTVMDGVSKFGTVTRNYSDSAIQSLAAGSYTLVSTVSGTVNYMGLTHSIPFTVTGPATKVALPSAKTGLVYTGTTQTGVATGTGYTLSGNTGMTAGSYTAIATLKDGYEWSDGVSSRSRTISWSIAKATNSWWTQPSLSCTEFEEGASVTISLGSVKFGVRQANYTAAELAQLAAGSYTLVVSVMGTDNYTGLTKSIPFTVTAKPTVSNLYCVIDLSAGASAKSYSVEYVDAEPSGGWDDVYKTSKLVLRRVEKGSFSMMSKGKTSISKGFYVGVFEVTQKQYELVMGTNPASGYGVGDTLPVYKVSYDDIRGASAGAGWPTSSAVDGESFLGKLRARTSIDFDLPTEAQWEYACRAGTTGKYYWTEAGLSTSQCAWYISNSGSVTHNVGTKRSNDWGIFDMSGNVSEWCRDWYSSTLAYGNDPKGAASASYNRRMTRGGCYSSGESDMRMDDTYYRSGVDAATRSSSTGFRLMMPK